MAANFNNPFYWRQHAEEARATAEDLTDEKARKQIIEIAEGYDRLAKMAEMRTLGKERKR
jgi:hypothetical protein